MIEDTNEATVEKLANINCQSGFYNTDDGKNYEALCKNGLVFSDADKNYIFIHLAGSHAPYILDENCQKSNTATPLSQTKGAFLFIKKYLNELKRLGVYDNSIIVISGDHGKPYSDVEPIYNWEKDNFTDHAPTVAMFYKPKNSNNSLNYSDIPIQSGNIIP